MDQILLLPMLVMWEIFWLNIKHPAGQLGGKNGHRGGNLAARFFSLKDISACQD
jgi:hypothetical protein